jgi:hypothetical protein
MENQPIGRTQGVREVTLPQGQLTLEETRAFSAGLADATAELMKQCKGKSPEEAAELLRNSPIPAVIAQFAQGVSRGEIILPPDATNPGKPNTDDLAVLAPSIKLLLENGHQVALTRGRVGSTTVGYSLDPTKPNGLASEFLRATR